MRKLELKLLKKRIQIMQFSDVPVLFWGRKQIQFLKQSVYNTRRFTKHRILLLASATPSLHNTLELTAKLLPSQERATTGKTLTTAHFILYNGALRGWEVSVLSNTSYLSSRIHFLPAAITLGGTWLLKYNTYHAYICIYILLTQQDILSSGDIR